MKPTIQDYESQLKGKDCKWCRREDHETGKTKVVSLENEPIQHWEHEGGHPVDGFPTNRWLYVECPECKYQWSLGKLGLPDFAGLQHVHENTEG